MAKDVIKLKFLRKESHMSSYVSLQERHVKETYRREGGEKTEAERNWSNAATRSWKRQGTDSLLESQEGMWLC